MTKDINLRAVINALNCYANWALGRSRASNLPLNLDIILTKACNLNCRFCISYASLKQHRWLDFDLYQRIAAELFPTAQGVYFCSGGEPLLYPHLRQALRIARDFRTMTVVTSNGMLLGREVAGWLCEDQSLNNLAISFDGARPHTLEYIRRGADYGAILQNLDYLRHLKVKKRLRYPKVWMRFVLMQGNAAELPEMIDLCAKYGAERLVVIHLKPTGELGEDQSLVGRMSGIAEVIQETRRRAARAGVRLQLPPKPSTNPWPTRCMKPWDFCQIDTDGSLRHCYYAWRQRLGFFDQGFKQAWRGEHWNALRRTLGEANPFFPFCRYCPAQGARGAPREQLVEPSDQSLVIDGLEHLQVVLSDRSCENLLSMQTKQTEA